MTELKATLRNIGDIFAEDNVILVTDPVYPVYVDSNIMAGRKILYADGTEENNFCAMPDPDVKADIIYLCSREQSYRRMLKQGTA